MLDLEKLIAETPYLFDELKDTDAPIFIYGTGNGGDKIIDLLESHGIEITGIFASDGFVRDRTFRSHKVRSYSDVIGEYGEGAVILAVFGSILPEVIDRFYSLARRHKFRLPYAPLYGGTEVSPEYLRKNSEALQSAYSCLSDDRSRRLFGDILRFRLSGDIAYLTDCEAPDDSYRRIFADLPIRTVIDCGAYRGDTARIFENVFPGIDEIVALEPDARSFRKLAEYAENKSGCRITAVNAAVGDSVGMLEFTGSGGRGAALAGNSRRAKVSDTACVTVDSLAVSRHIDLIKYDTEGAEDAAIDGSLKTVERDKPALAISLYHKTDDMFELILKISRLYPESRMLLARPRCLPDWDLTLFAIPNDRNA